MVFEVWKKKAGNRNDEKWVHTSLKHIERTAAVWDKVHIAQFIYEYPIWQMAKKDPKVKQYLDTRKTNKRNDKLEMEIINKWLIKEIKKDTTFKLYTKKYGNVETIMNYKPSMFFFK